MVAQVHPYHFILAHPIRKCIRGAFDEHQAKAPDIRAVAVFLIPHALWRHVLEGPHEAVAHVVSALQSDRHAKIGHLRSPRTWEFVQKQA